MSACLPGEVTRQHRPHHLLLYPHDQRPKVERTGREPAVRVVKLDLDERAHGRAAARTSTVVQEGLTLLAGEGRVLVREDEADGGEEVGFARAVATDEEVEAGTTRRGGRVSVGLKRARRGSDWSMRLVQPDVFCMGDIQGALARAWDPWKDARQASLLLLAPPSRP